VDDVLAGSLFNIRLISRIKLDRSVCLTSVETGQDIQCKNGPGGAEISNLLLPKGAYLLRVGGETNPDAQYILRLDFTTPPSPAHESEPNDAYEYAAALDSGTPLTGQYDGNDTDFYRFTTTGEPQLYDVQISGSGISELDYVKPDGTQLATANITDGAGGTLYDLYLVPGDHWLRTSGVDGSYVISMTGNGPPPADGEHETNNDEISAEPIILGETRTGRLVDQNEIDFYRFALAAREHVSISLVSPDDGSVQLSVTVNGTNVWQGSGSQIGDKVTADLFLDPGDYAIRLIPSQGSTGRYTLTTKREDPFAVKDDQEPNNAADQAQPIRPDQSISGRIDDSDPADWYAIKSEPDQKLAFTVTGDSVFIALSDGDTTYDLQQRSGEGPWTTAQRVPKGVPLYLVVTGIGPYTVTFGTGKKSGGLFKPPTASAEKSVLDASLTMDSTTVAAYWEQQQTVGGTLTLTNTSDSDQTVDLKALTSHYAWHVDLGSDQVDLAAGATVPVPVTVVIDPDAWANIPVRITVGAVIGEAQPVSAFFEITPTGDSPPINPISVWPVPQSMLGGLNVASLALGAVPTGTIDPAKEALLYDGLTPAGGSFQISSPAMPLEVSVDLVGDAPVPVSGVILNPQTNDGYRQSAL
ncbi:MAG TPA: hypothetical protein PK819_13065, partial [Thermomicrobiales bacterium]|nr:hypothetical protein [Thermomicrobiales bacterium]